MNAAQLLHGGQLFRGLAGQFVDIKAYKRRTEALACDALQGRLIIVDEVDYLKPRQVYALFELQARVFMVANSLNFLNEDPRLQSRG